MHPNKKEKEKRKKKKEKKKKKKEKEEPPPLSPAVQQLSGKISKRLSEVEKVYKREDFSPFRVVAKTLDDYDDLKKINLEKEIEKLKLHRRILRKTIGQIVDVNYTGFNRTIKNFSDILNSFDDSREQIGGLIENIEDTEKLLEIQTDYLKSLFGSFRENKAFIAILRELSDICTVPERLSQALKEKHYLHAVNLINETSAKLSGDKKNISALKNVRNSVNDTLEALPEILFDRLNEIVYSGVEYFVQEEPSKKSKSLKLPLKKMIIRRSKRMRGNSAAKQTEKLAKVALQQSKRRYSMIVTDDVNKNVDEESVQFPKMLVETLARLSQLKQGRARLSQSLHLKLTAVVREHVNQFLKKFKEDEKSVKLMEVSMDPELSELEKARAQESVLSEMVGGLLGKLLVVLNNFKFLNRLFERKFQQKDEEMQVKESLKKKKMELEETDMAKPTMESSLNQKLSKEVLLRLRETLRIALDELRIDMSANSAYVASVEDILKNFIEKEINNDVSNLTVRILVDMFGDKLKRELKAMEREVEKKKKKRKERKI